MIQANELRIGNWVTELIKNRIVAIDGIESNQDFVWVNYLNGSGQYKVGINDIEPIPITPEILEKCGFEWSIYHQAWHKQGFAFDLSERSVGGFWMHKSRLHSEIICPEINYLHQLQNIYFSLTGEELDVKL